MNCSQVQPWLLQSEDPRAEAAPPHIAEHLRDCEDCGSLARRLSALQEQWRELPPSPRCIAAQAEFLSGLPSRLAPAGRNPPLQSPSRRRFLRWATAAAAGATAGGAGLWALLAGREAEAAEELLDGLVDWNLQLTQSQSAPIRAELYHQGEARFQSALARITMPAEHVAVAQRLLENGAWLVDHHDALDEAERFDHLAERLLKLASHASQQGHYRRMDRLLDQYCRVLESGVNPNIELAEDRGALDFLSQRRLERLVLDDPSRVRQLDLLLQRVPKASRNRIRRAMGLAGNRGKKPHPKRSPSAPDRSGT